MGARTAACSCGQLQVHVTAEPRRVSLCHCLACQRRSGSVFAAQASFAKDSANILGSSTEFQRVGDGGTRARFHFCPHCGSTVYYLLQDRDDVIVIPVGAFAEPGFPAPTFSVYEERMHGWVQLPADMEHMD